MSTILPNIIYGICRPFVISPKKVISAAIGIMVASVLRIAYKGYDILGTVLMAFMVRVPKDRQPLPPLGDRKLLRLSAQDIAQKIRSKEVSAEEVVRTFIGRIVEVNSGINAVVNERFEIAINEAKKVDHLIRSGEYTEAELEEKYPLLGVPFTIKDSYCVEGLKHTAGHYKRKDYTAPEDATVVTMLKAVGAIPLGVTNVSELCMWWEAVNTVYGRSANPYDTRHISGGSSGGEAALQGAAGSAFGIGSDIGGSIRMPSFFCGVFGHKPTTGLIPNEGQVPVTRGRLAEFLTTGPVARHAHDLRFLYDIMLGEKVNKMKPVPDLSRVRLFYMEDDGGNPITTPISRDMKAVMKKSLQYLEKKYGLKPQKANLTKFYHSLEIWAQAMAGADVPTFCEELALHNGKINPFVELVKKAFWMSPHTLPALVLGVIEKLAYAGRSLPRHKEMIEMGYSLAKELQELLGDDGIMLYHPFPYTAPRHHRPMFRPADFAYTAIFNILGVPVTQVPLGLDADGLPLGIQVVGGMFSDHLCLSIAEELEEGFGGWVPPSSC
ncbi:unnamed protein product [Allacma fusca]|uniref:Amidase domain-containing protein n=1 Tax=Allacma fusca TaxID=39272 RepID=A0A8J2PAH4_9HEXA|nr:unnamed protein product [Allacma fusca]